MRLTKVLILVFMVYKVCNCSNESILAIIPRDLIEKWQFSAKEFNLKISSKAKQMIEYMKYEESLIVEQNEVQLLKLHYQAQEHLYRWVKQGRRPSSCVKGSLPLIAKAIQESKNEFCTCQAQNQIETDRLYNNIMEGLQPLRDSIRAFQIYLLICYNYTKASRLNCTSVEAVQIYLESQIGIIYAKETLLDAASLMEPVLNQLQTCLKVSSIANQVLIQDILKMVWDCSGLKKENFENYNCNNKINKIR